MESSSEQLAGEVDFATLVNGVIAVGISVHYSLWLVGNSVRNIAHDNLLIPITLQYAGFT